MILCLTVLNGWAQEHWSLQPMKRVAVPAKGNPIDYFIGRKLREQGLKSSPAADRVTLLRRVTLDLTGLPPDPKKVKAFVEDPRNIEIFYADSGLSCSVRLDVLTGRRLRDFIKRLRHGWPQ